MNQLSLPKKRNIPNESIPSRSISEFLSNLNGTDSNKETRHIEFLLTI